MKLFQGIDFDIKDEIELKKTKKELGSDGDNLGCVLTLLIYIIVLIYLFIPNGIHSLDFNETGKKMIFHAIILLPIHFLGIGLIFFIISNTIEKIIYSIKKKKVNYKEYITKSVQLNRKLPILNKEIDQYSKITYPSIINQLTISDNEDKIPLQCILFENYLILNEIKNKAKVNYKFIRQHKFDVINKCNDLFKNKHLVDKYQYFFSRESQKPNNNKFIFKISDSIKEKVRLARKKSNYIDVIHNDMDWNAPYASMPIDTTEHIRHAIFNYEKNRLFIANIFHLLPYVKLLGIHEAQQKGYDIASFNTNDEPIMIKIKLDSILNEEDRYLFSREYDAMNNDEASYQIYRIKVFDLVKKKCKIEILQSKEIILKNYGYTHG